MPAAQRPRCTLRTANHHHDRLLMRRVPTSVHPLHEARFLTARVLSQGHAQQTSGLLVRPAARPAYYGTGPRKFTRRARRATACRCSVQSAHRCRTCTNSCSQSPGSALEDTWRIPCAPKQARDGSLASIGAASHQGLAPGKARAHSVHQFPRVVYGSNQQRRNGACQNISTSACQPYRLDIPENRKKLRYNQIFARGMFRIHIALWLPMCW